MPTYDYRCEDCGKEQTWLRGIEERDNPKDCTCGGVARRIITFTGSVWAPTAGGMK